MPASCRGAGRLTRRLWFGAAACVLAAYALVIASHYSLGELSLDEASTFFISALDWPEVIARSLSFQSQPPLFYLLLHGWIRIGDTEPILRALPLLCMVGAALTLLSASFLSPITRIVSASLLLLTTYGDYLSLLIRPYALSAWLSLGSFLLFTLLLTGPRRRFVWYASFVVVTSLMVYSLAMTAWTLLAEGLCAAAAFGVELSRTDARRARERHGAVLWALAAVALVYVPYVIAVWHLQGHLGHPSIRSTLIAATNPRYFVSGPLYLLATPWRLGYVAAAAMVYGVWSGFRRGDPMVGILVMIVIVQISMTHGFLEGRSEFGFRYLAPAFPALCILAGLGADRSLSRPSFAGWGVAAGAALVLLAATVSFVRAPGAPPVGPWRPVRTDVEKLPGTKVVFFDEPLDGLDANAAVGFKALIQTLAREGKTIVYSSHILDVVERVCDRVIIIDKGRLLLDGRPDVLVAESHAGTLERLFTQLTGGSELERRAEDFAKTFRP